jgi:hypothetical protein
LIWLGAARAAPTHLENNMPIYLRHPTHGTKVATMEMEAEYDERSGWERFDPTVEEETVEDPAENAIVTTRKRRLPTA